MLATVNSRRRSVSRGPDDQAQGVVMEGWWRGEWGGGARKSGGDACSRGRRTLLGDFYQSIFPIFRAYSCASWRSRFWRIRDSWKTNRYAIPAETWLHTDCLWDGFFSASALFLLGLRCTHSARELVDTHLLWLEGVRFVSGTFVTVPSDFLINRQVITDA